MDGLLWAPDLWAPDLWLAIFFGWVWLMFVASIVDVVLCGWGAQCASTCVAGWGVHVCGGFG